MDINSEGAGKRVISFTMERSEDVETKIVGGYEAVEASIEKHLPESLEYSGLTIGDTEVTGSFTLSFDSIKDYEAKVKTILEAGGITDEPEVTFFNSDSILKSGFQFEEDFTSTHLLAWLPEALVVDGVIEESNKSNVLEGEDESTLVINGETYTPDYGTRMSFDYSTDNGFSIVNFIVDPKEDGAYDVVVELGRDGSVSAPAKQRDDEFIDSLNVEGMEVDAVGSEVSEYVRTLSFSAASVEELTEKLNAVLGTDSAEFSEVVRASVSNGLETVYAYSGSLDPSAICASFRCVSNVTIEPPAGYDSADTTALSSSQVSKFDLEFSKPLRFASANVVMNVSASRSWTLDVTYVAKIDEVEPFAEDVVSMLSPRKEVGSIEVSDADGLRTYKLSFDHGDKKKGAIARFLGGSVGVSEIPASQREYLEGNYLVTLDFDPSYLLENTPIDEIRGEISLGSLNSFANDSIGWDVNGSTATFVSKQGSFAPFYGSASGMTTTALVTAIIVGVFVLILVVLGIIFRKKLAPVFSRVGKGAVAASRVVAGRAKAAQQSATAAMQARQERAASMQADVSGMQNVADSGLQENAGASGVFVRNGDRYTFREHYLR